MNKTQSRTLAIALLDDANGISEDAFNKLQESCNGCGDIFAATKAVDGRFFLPEDHGLTAQDTQDTEATQHYFANCGGLPRCTKCGCDEDDAYVGGQECNS